MCAKKAKIKTPTPEEIKSTQDALMKLWRQYENANKEKITRGQQRLKEAIPFLAAIGVNCLTFSYDGYGDSGDFTDVEVVGAQNGPTSVKALDEKLLTLDQDDHPYGRFNTEALIDAAYDFLPGGWEINEGSYGQIIVDVTKNTVKREHHERYVDSTYEETMWRIADDL